ncbi:MAG TPA: chaperone NapD [Povalibacter sp.]|uniref:chaperone NapD n=1 Tax=Povalibacter sp. TaxID=1962978 RepID=UPI002C732540|nr:chaperone NapD [Povalibacter sp.]HMN47430.1 chaperone NapD [Povalibacter sp.]
MRTLLSRRDLFTATPRELQEEIVHIASLLLHIVPSCLDTLRRTVAELPGAELHATAHPAKFAVVLEAADARSLADATQRLQDLRGVLTVSIVAHLSERARDLDEPMEEQA